MTRVRVEVIAPTLQGLGLCGACELVLDHAQLAESASARPLDEYPPEWRQEYQRLLDWVYDLASQHGERIHIRIVDPQSLEGLLKSLRYWVRQYPTWIVEGRKLAVGWDRGTLDAALAQYQDDDRRAPGSLPPPVQGRARRIARMLADMFYGATIYDMVRELNKERGMLERLFVLAVFGDVLGVPILPPYFALRLLPYVVPRIATWRRTMMRERDLTDLFDQEIG